MVVDGMSTAEARFAEIYGSFFRHVHAYCRRRIAPDGVDDATAETFVVAWRKIDQVPSGSEALPWLYGVAYGVVSNAWRGQSRQRRLREKLNMSADAPPALPEEIVVMRQEARGILDALSSLKPIDREVLRLSVWEGLGAAELAVALDLSPEAARQRLSRARRNLAARYNRLSAGRWASSVARKGGGL